MGDGAVVAWGDVKPVAEHLTQVGGGGQQNHGLGCVKRLR